jgi:hypothetical protein
MAEPGTPIPVPLEPPPSVRALPAWPADSLPSAAEAERAVLAVLAGTAGALDPTLTTRLSAELTEVERAAFDGTADDAAGAVRAAAALRWRLGAAVVTAPERGPVDADTVAQLLADADAVLGALKDSALDAPPEFGEAVAGIRKSLVADAISLQNAVTRLGATPRAAAPAAPIAPSPAARVLSVVEGEAEVAPARSSSGKLIALLVVAVIAAGAYHAWRWTNRPVPVATVAGAPVTATGGPGANGQTLLFTRDGKPFPPAELEQLVAAQAKLRMRVRELSPGVYAIEPDVKETTR